MLKKLMTAAGVLAGLTLAAAPAMAQTKLKWAHVYETSEPFHTSSVWAAGEIAALFALTMEEPDWRCFVRLDA